MDTNRLPSVSFQCFTHEQIKEINKKIKKNILQKEDLSKTTVTTAIKKGDFFRIPCSPLMDVVMHPFLYQCQHANKDFFGYDIYWDFHLESFNYNVYGENGEYDWHIDANKKNTPVDMKLTCLLNLSEETYEGGEFYLINYEDKIKFDSGMGIVFNSLIAHKVTPVTKGERITLTYWGYGPMWK